MSTGLSAHSHVNSSHVNPVAYWSTMLIGGIIALIGLVLAAGGIWLISLGGSWYYLVAGVGLVASGGLMIAGRMLGLYAYLITYIFTLIWALWEVGFDGWAQVPRLVAPTVLLVLVLLTIPVLRKLDPGQGRSRPAGAVSGVAVLAFASFGLLAVPGLLHTPAQAQDQVQTENQAATPDAGGTAAPAVEPDAASPQAPDESAAAETAPPALEAAEQEGANAGAADENAEISSTDTEQSPEPMAMADVGEDWPAYGGTYHADRYSPLDQITPDNVGDLEKVWTYETGDLPNEQTKGEYSPETTPLKIGENVYLCSAKNKLMALEAETGLERWHYDPQVPDDAIPYGATCRGVVYYENTAAGPDELCATRIIEGTLDARLIAVDANTGQVCSDFGTNGAVDMRDGIGETVPGWYGNVAAPTIVRGVVVMGAQVKDGQAEDAPSGVIRGYDAITGELLWAWDMGQPELNGEPPEGETYSRGTPNMWTSAAGDDELGYVYIPLGNSAVDYYGGNRKDFENEYSSSLVALDVTTGKEVWHFQTVHYDIWDYDLGSQPSLVDFPSDDGAVPAIVLPSKQGEIYVLNRETGESLFPVEEREVPTEGGVEDPDRISPTQPYSGYATLAQDRLQEKDMWGMSPLDQLWCRIQFRMANYDGEYTLPTEEGHYIEYPGYNGGSDWGSVAIDTDNGILIANYNDMPNYNRLLDREEAEKRGLTPITNPQGSHDNPQAGSPYAIEINAGWRESWTGLMCKQPPYGGIRAIDLKTGDTLWDEPIGEARENGPFGIPSMLPITIGTPNNGGPLITAGGLVFIAAATDNLIRAIDIKTGEVVWTDELPAGGQSTPMTYSVAGRQYIAFMAGGHHFMETPVGDYVVAYALPEQANNPQ